MEVITADGLRDILEKHKKWLAGKDGGLRADLRGADLREANLCVARIDGIVYDHATTGVQNCPEGDIIGWKKVRSMDSAGTCIIKLLIPADARRSRATTGKCRAEYVKVLEGNGRTIYSNIITEYREGEIVRADGWDEDRWNECSHGIHFFLDKMEAEQW